MAEEQEDKGITFTIDWQIPDDIVARYATNMLVQRAENEFIISFFETKPPILLGDADEISAQLKSMGSVLRANCVAQIIVAAEKMPSFVEALQKNLSKFVINVDSKE